MAFHFNIRGILVAGPPMALGYVIAKKCAVEDYEPLSMVIGGPLTVAVDAIYRRVYEIDMFEPVRGPSICWLPVWLIGATWAALGFGRFLGMSKSGEIAVMICAGLVALQCWYFGINRWRNDRRAAKLARAMAKDVIDQRAGAAG